MMACKLFSLVALALATSVALAADDAVAVFDVEIIVLRHVNADAGELPVHRLDEQDRAGSRPRRTRYEPVPASALQLGGVNEKLLRSSEWSPILHAGWRQPVEPNEQAAAMSIAGARGGAQVRGTVRLSLDRYLRLELDLALEDGASAPAQLVQARRMRSGRVHYFDHPRFGVIALVTPRE